MRFQGKVILVTGASTGIGAAAAKLFVKEGANVVMVANDDQLFVTAAECAKLGVAPLAVKAELSNDEDVKRVIKETIDKHGKLDILVNNAGIIRFGGILDGKVVEHVDEVMRINFRANVILTTLAVPHLIKSKGNIVNTSSMKSCTAQLGMLAYGASKAAITNFTRGIALELAPHGVRANVVSPGPVSTNIAKNAGVDISFDDWKDYCALKRVLEPEEVANVIAFLASDDAKGITGSDYFIDNGAKLLH